MVRRLWSPARGCRVPVQRDRKLAQVIDSIGRGAGRDCATTRHLRAVVCMLPTGDRTATRTSEVEASDRTGPECRNWSQFPPPPRHAVRSALRLTSVVETVP